MGLGEHILIPVPRSQLQGLMKGVVSVLMEATRMTVILGQQEYQESTRHIVDS